MNIKEQLAAKVETINTILNYIKEIEQTTNFLSIDLINMKQYLETMKKNYKDTYDFINVSNAPKK